MTDNARRETTSGPLAFINPSHLGRPVGYAQGVAAPPGWRAVYVAGQTASQALDGERPLSFADEFAGALDRVVAVVRAAGGEADHIARMTVYVTDLDAYRDSRAGLGEIWQRRMGRHYPAMSLVGVTGLVDPRARVEIEADAVVPSGGER
ncbi:MAG: RidA family protein [Acidobacteriota bacterium]